MCQRSRVLPGLHRQVVRGNAIRHARGLSPMQFGVSQQDLSGSRGQPGNHLSALSRPRTISARRRRPTGFIILAARWHWRGATPVALETGSILRAIRPHRRWNQAVELVQEIGRRTANITGDARESTCLFQQLSVALYRGGMRSHFKTRSQPDSSLQSVVSFSYF